ncbi:hypothetical protein CC85DRAFT_287028 [Cutaneotrichosporon oleaginosum]|uniref:Extracellular membrane protein CFEM domain-containing protein n=1 Tax=Cutaneotrichosporon oleaginosum TaxID=879819 RepID=A0A0J0XIF0_9TREE|nr:uncharacterized protein CC85DRAFT_287028 [Cutaneotrichosporon oleaginosum]KLT40881.1 hypothetical protein CC85DRAFT_287028 [Cutaneotrichosporon oleaginosum]TXT09260.1 hypothetical protein COLE_03194 [Cutaneotrichosporon oleaginosum]
MRVVSALLVSAAVVAASPAYLVAGAVERAIAARQATQSQSTANGAFDLALIPSICDTPCATYKEIFGTCPGDPSNAVCAKACNQSVHNEFIVCTSCLVNNGPAQGMAQHDIDILNIAQQQLVQQCIDMGTPQSFAGTVQLPSTVAYPSGVVNATYSVSQASSTQAVQSTAAPSASTPAAPAAASSQGSGAGVLRPAAAVGAVVAAAALVAF